MKKSFIYICSVFVCLFVFSLELNAASKTCKYTNPFGGEDLTLVFTDISNDYSYYSKRNYVDVETTGKGIFIDPNSSSITSFYVATKPSYSPNTYYVAPGTASFSGKSWVLASSMVNLKVSYSENSCPDLTYSHYIVDNNVNILNDVVVIHGGVDSDCASGYSACKSLNLKENGDAVKVSSCPFEFKIPNSDTKTSLIFTSYSDGTVRWSYNQWSGVVDPDAENPVMYYNSSQSGNIVRVNQLKISKDDYNKLISIDKNGKLTCNLPAVVCAEVYNEYNQTFKITTDVNSCPKNLFGQTNENNVSIGDSENANIGDNGSNTTKPNNKVSSCSAYIGVAGQGDNIASFLDDIWDILKVISILLVIALSMFEFTKGASNDKEKLQELVKKFVLRIVFLAVLLLLPTLIDAIGQIAGVDNVLCGIK